MTVRAQKFLTLFRGLPIADFIKLTNIWKKKVEMAAENRLLFGVNVEISDAPVPHKTVSPTLGGALPAN